MTNNNENLTKLPYYFDDLSLESAVKILKTVKKEGAFLIRRRTTGDIKEQPFALSWYQDSTVLHSRIYREDNGQYTLLETNDKKTKGFDSIIDLVSFFDENNNPKCKINPKLANILEKYKVSHSAKNVKIDDHHYLDYLPYYLKNVSRTRVEQILQKISENEVFFIRKQTDEKDALNSPFEISIYYKPSVYHLKILKDQDQEYSIENNDELAFASLPELVEYYNYEKLTVSDKLSTYLKIHSRYIKDSSTK